MDITHALDGFVESAAGPIARVSTSLSARDFWHDWQTRWSIKRNQFNIPTGLYAIGNPGEQSPVLVTANYKLTFDKLRVKLAGMDLWLLVIDTKGVNVWCSAGKGTFSAPEIIKMINRTNLAKVVKHRQIILPQLAAPGVSSQMVARASGFKVIYGPIRAEDIPAFVSNGNKADPAMRRVRFDLGDRIILTPVELILGSRFIPVAFLLLFVINLINRHGAGWGQVLKATGYNCLPYIIAVIIGTVAVPVLLPWLPFRAFALKGVAAGIIWSAIVIWLGDAFMIQGSITAGLGHAILLTALISFLALNFTGSTPFTSFSGAQKETLAGVPVMLLASLAGTVLLIISRFMV